MKKILVTGAHGFIGRNLTLALTRVRGTETIPYDIDSPETQLGRALDICDVIFHLAGTNRPPRDEEFITGNVGSIVTVLEGLRKRTRRPLIVLSSSSQALLDNPYGRSKRSAEEALLDYCRRTGSSARIFRLPGVFGKWCRPNYNSVVATFCHNIIRDMPIDVSDPLKEIELVHVDDVTAAFIGLIDKSHEGANFSEVAPTFKVRLGDLAERLKAFRKSREDLSSADISDPFLRRLFGTFMSYLPADGFAYDLSRKEDDRGLLSEIMKMGGRGQFFVSRTKPGVTRGNHYHDLKVEKFIVLDGDALIRFRNLATGEIKEYPVAGRDLQVVDIAPGWTHSIQNVGRAELIVLFWASSVFDPARPDTFPAEV